MGITPASFITVEAARQKYPDAKIWAIWEPHTASRTERLQHEFANALKLPITASF